MIASFIRKEAKIKFSKEIVEEIKKQSDYERFGARRVDKIIEERIDSYIIDNLVRGNHTITIESLEV